MVLGTPELFVGEEGVYISNLPLQTSVFVPCQDFQTMTCRQCTKILSVFLMQLLIFKRKKGFKEMNVGVINVDLMKAIKDRVKFIICLSK